MIIKIRIDPSWNPCENLLEYLPEFPYKIEPCHHNRGGIHGELVGPYLKSVNA